MSLPAISPDTINLRRQPPSILTEAPRRHRPEHRKCTDCKTICDSAVFYHYILIGNHAIQEHVFSRKGILKQYAVFNNTALADLYSSEQDRVFNSSLDYTAIGDTVNTAARLESNAPAGTVLISSAVYEAVQGRIKAVSLGNLPLKGKSADIEVFKVESIEG